MRIEEKRKRVRWEELSPGDVFTQTAVYWYMKIEPVAGYNAVDIESGELYVYDTGQKRTYRIHGRFVED